MNPRFYKNVEWSIVDIGKGSVSHSDAQLAVLMDIRTELQKLNSVIRCPNFMAIPRKLDAIKKNTTKKRRKKKEGPR